jgi:integrase
MAKENKASCKVILHKIKTLKDDRHPIVLRVTFLRKRKYYSLGVSATEKEWEQILNASGRSKFKTIQKTVRETENQAEEVILEIEKKDKFTFDTFEKTFFPERNNTTVFQFFDQLMESFTKQGRIGNADIYKGTLNELKRFRKKKDLSFDDVTYTFLTRWETSLSPTNSINSIGIHMRTLRSAYNKAIKEGIASQENYPFKDYQIKKEAPIKRALRKEHIQKIYEYEAKPMSADWHAQQLFIFSYLCQGMAFSDMAYLKWENIIDDRIVYKRVKTIRTSKNPKVISIKITQNIAEILNAFRKADAQYDDYIFPILRKDMQPVTMKNTIKSKRKNFNKQLRKICKKVGIEGNITSYVARHSYATVLKRNGVSFSIISESLGHQTEHMTQTYLDSFDNEVIDAANEGLL